MNRIWRLDIIEICNLGAIASQFLGSVPFEISNYNVNNSLQLVSNL